MTIRIYINIRRIKHGLLHYNPPFVRPSIAIEVQAFGLWRQDMDIIVYEIEWMDRWMKEEKSESRNPNNSWKGKGNISSSSFLFFFLLNVCRIII